MACSKMEGCQKRGYCEYGAYCEKVHPKIRENLKNTKTQPSYIDVEIFKSRGAGRNCTERD